MASITMRDLVRESKKIFDALETEKRPIVVTRYGRPFAALMPIDQEQAEAYLLASTAEIAESQRRAERAVDAGQAIPLSEALKRAEEDLERTTEADFPVAAEFTPEFVRPESNEVAADIAKTTEYITNNTISSVVQVANESEISEEWVQRIRKLNSSLMEISFLKELDRALAAEGGQKRRSTGRRKTQHFSYGRERVALASARTFVLDFNSTLLSNVKNFAPEEVVETFESELRGGVAYAKSSGYLSMHDSPVKQESHYRRGLLHNR